MGTKFKTKLTTPPTDTFFISQKPMKLKVKEEIIQMVKEKPLTIQKTYQIPFLKSKISTKQAQIIWLATKTKQAQKLKTKQAQVPLLSTQTKQISKLRTKQIEALVQIPKLAPITTTIQKLKTRQTGIRRLRQRFKKPLTYPFGFIIPRRKKKKGRISKVKKKRVSGEYSGEIKRFGRWKRVAKGNRDKVIAKARSKVQKELGASYRVKNPQGKTIPLPIGKQFRKSRNKRTPFVVVEKSRFRLDSPKERGEIQFAKRVKKGKVNKSKTPFF